MRSEEEEEEDDERFRAGRAKEGCPAASARARAHTAHVPRPTPRFRSVKALIRAWGRFGLPWPAVPEAKRAEARRCRGCSRLHR